MRWEWVFVTFVSFCEKSERIGSVGFTQQVNSAIPKLDLRAFLRELLFELRDLSDEIDLRNYDFRIFPVSDLFRISKFGFRISGA